MTQVRTPEGHVLIEQLDYTPAPGETIRIGGAEYKVENVPPRTEMVSRGPNMEPKYMRVVTASPTNGTTHTNVRRGPAIEG